MIALAAIAGADPTLRTLQYLRVLPHRCDVCGCSKHDPCVGVHTTPSGRQVQIPCAWVKPFLCSSCADEAVRCGADICVTEDDQVLLAHLDTPELELVHMSRELYDDWQPLREYLRELLPELAGDPTGEAWPRLPYNVELGPWE